MGCIWPAFPRPVPSLQLAARRRLQARLLGARANVGAQGAGGGEPEDFLDSAAACPLAFICLFVCG